MAARASVTLSDAEGTPVNHVFNPYGPNADKSGGFVQWQVLPASGIGLGSEYLRMAFRPPVNGSPFYRTEVRLWMPTLEVTSGGTGSGFVAAPTLAYANQIVVTSLMHQRSTLQERKNIRMMAYQFASLTNPWKNAVESYDPTYG